MAFSSSSSLLPNPSTSYDYLSSSSSLLFLQTIRISSNRFRPLNLKTSWSCSYQTIEVENQEPHNSKVVSIAPKKKKTKQKPRPSFYEQIRDKWSLRIDSQRVKFPWQEQEDQKEEEEKVEEEIEQQCSQLSEENGENPLLNDPVSLSLRSHLSSAPWVNRNNFKKPQFDSNPELAKKSSLFYGDEVSEFHKESKELRGVTNNNADFHSKTELAQEDYTFEDDEISEFRKESNNGVRNFSDSDKEVDDFGQNVIGFLDSSRETDSVQLPWESKSGLESRDKGNLRRSKAEVAEKTIPENELRRLRNISLRMFERIKVRVGGITQALVDRIHEKWTEEEVVKLKFEGAPAFNMKRTHETLESRTGGLVIWRSGSSLVLYRGMAYKLPCVQQYTKLSRTNRNYVNSSEDSTSDLVENVGLNDAAKIQESPGTKAAKSYETSSEELMDMGDLNNLLDELGPRYIDWTGPEPLPVDADLLPSVVPGYTRPFRILPHRVRPVLGNKRTTLYRRLARSSPPHFALGRNRELQGLAMAMVKLWERNAIAKIAIKHGVLNTRNERMAEELKKLTGGTLLSRNKDFIVFYRGNDFLSPPVTEALLERQKFMEVQQKDEEIARDRASALICSKTKAAKGPLVAGTLAETLAAKSRWGNEPSSEDLEKMKKDFALAKRASLVRYLEKKIARAQDKVNKAEKALRKVQEFLQPAEIPSDLETITDEERILFRKMGLSLKAFLLVGRREVFDGTVENMHLHWKHRELVKIIVRGRNFPQVKHMAISLEAESGGLLVSVDKTTQGYAIILYRGKNYQRPQAIRPKNLLTKRQALARSIELQRREALIHHIYDVREKIELLKSGLDQMEAGKEAYEELHSRLNDAYSSDDDFEDEGEEAYLATYNNGDEDSVRRTPQSRNSPQR